MHCWSKLKIRAHFSFVSGCGVVGVRKVLSGMGGMRCVDGETFLLLYDVEER